MNKKIRNLKIFILLASLIEIILMGVFVLLYTLNVFELQNHLDVRYFAYFLYAIVFVNDSFLYWHLYRINKVRNESDIRTTDIIGNDVNETYVFGKVGFCVVDQDGIVLWETDYLKTKHIELINKNIFEYDSQFKEFIDKDNDNILKIEINNDIYSVKYLRTSGVFIFKDISDYENLSRYAREQGTCVGIILIDNYQDITKNNEENSEVIAQVRNEISQYAEKYNILIRSFRSDGYFAVCNNATLDNLRKDKFSILDLVKKHGKDENVNPTLSIGFGHSFPDVNKLHNLAVQALDIATSRGGDQAIVLTEGAEVEKYGGKSAAVEKKNKVELRINANALIALIENASDIYVMGHVNMDMDALGACIGIKAICDSFNKPCKIVVDLKITEKKTKEALIGSFDKETLSELAVNPREAIDKIKDTSLLVVVDTSNPKITMSPELVNKANKIAIVDHHRRGDYYIEDNVYSYIDTSASSASELIVEMMRYATKSNQIKMDSTYATIMLSGIFLDTLLYRNNTVGLRTYEASMILKEFGADNSQADDLLKDTYEEYEQVNDVLRTMTTIKTGVVYCVGESNELYRDEVLAKIANQCLHFKSINASFVVGRTSNNAVKISARSNGSINVQILIEKLGGGGHFSASAVVIKDKSLDEVKNMLVEVINLYIEDARKTERR